MPTFTKHVMVHKSPGQPVFFKPGDKRPDWAKDKVTNPALFEAETQEAPRERQIAVESTPEETPDDDEQTSDDESAESEDNADESSDDDESSDPSEEPDGYEELSNKDLRELLEDQDLSTAGTKKELIARLREAE